MTRKREKARSEGGEARRLCDLDRRNKKEYGGYQNRRSLARAKIRERHDLIV